MDQKKSTKRMAASNMGDLAKTDGALSLGDSTLLPELRELILRAQSDVARTVNSVLVQLYWQVGTRIRTEVLSNKRAEYGKQIVSTVSGKLAAEFGSGFSHPNMIKMLAFAERFPDSVIWLTLSTKLSWSRPFFANSKHLFLSWGLALHSLAGRSAS
jgi:hypothetical protein